MTTAEQAHQESEVYFEQHFTGENIENYTGHNDEVDAYRHAYVSAVLAFERGEGIAAALGWAHETKGRLKGQPNAEYNMDSVNNREGLNTGSGIDPEASNYKDLIASALAQKLQNGELKVLEPHFADSTGNQYSQPQEQADMAQAQFYDELVDEYRPDWEYDEPYESQPGRPIPSRLPEALEPFFNAPNEISPLVIDLDGDGIELTEFDAGTTTTFFDIDGDSFAEQTAWVDADDALLARDVNENGTIDDVTELFGSPSVDGFALLAALDSNHDLIIDENDDEWDTLLVWQDANGDAVSQSGELISLDTAGIRNIRLDLVEASTATIEGNPISHASVITWDNNSTDAIVDAWFVNDDVNTTSTGDYALDVQALFLPTLRGFGEIADLHIAMSQDEDLLDLVEAFASGFTLADFADNETLDGDIEEILYVWAGVNGVDPESRGPYIDAQKLEFLEKFFAQEYKQYGIFANPEAMSASVLKNSWHVLFEHVKAGLLIQAGAQELFDGTATYNPWTGEIEGALTLDETAIGILGGDAPAPGAANVAYWIAITEFLDAVKGLDNLTTDENIWLDDAIQDSDSSLSWNEIKEMLPYVLTGSSEGDIIGGTNGSETINGGAGDDTILAYAGNDTVHAGTGHDTINAGDDSDTVYGEDGDDTINGQVGADHLYGGDGNDILAGNHGGDYDNDILEGGLGGNFLYGGEGDDTYVYGGGNDLISEINYTTGGDDELVLPDGIILSDLTFSRVSTAGSATYFNDLLISIEGSGSIQIEGHFLSAGRQVETLVFHDTSTLDLTALSGLETFLTDGDDNYASGTSSADIVHGLAGDDYIPTSSGNDTLDGGEGNDSLEGGSGNDTYVFSEGFDIINESDGTDTIEIPDTVDPADV
jgi:Ca2+-binding RTX toxin-like protein